jgi:hypothetical protein
VLDGRIGLVVFGAFFLQAVYAQFSSLINHDTAWYLYAVDAFLDGGRLYQDAFFEVNPPLALFLTVPPVYVSRLTGLPSADLFFLYVFALIAVSLFLTGRLLVGAPGLPLVYRRGLLFAAMLALTVCPARGFAEREHLMFVLSLPYLMLAARRAAGADCGRGLGLLVGVMAALGFFLKPHFLLVPATLELYLLLVRRRPREVLRAETASLAATGLLYGLVVVLFTPDYLSRVVPYALQVYNNAYNNPLAFVVWRQETLLLPAVFALHWVTRRRLEESAVPEVFSIAVGGFFVVYLLQMKGWEYQLYPTGASLVLVLGAMLSRADSDRLETEPARSATAGSRGAMLAAALFLVSLVGAALWRGGYQNALAQSMAPIVREHAAGRAIYVFSTKVSAAFPLVTYTGVAWSSRFPTLWLLPGLERRRRSLTADTPAEQRALLDEIERFLIDAVVADFDARPPALVIVDVRREKHYFGDLELDYIDYFTADPRFAAIWSHYAPIERLGNYQVFKRRPNGGP